MCTCVFTYVYIHINTFIYINATGTVDSAKEIIDAGVQMDLRDNLELFLTTNNPSTFVSNIYTYVYIYIYIFIYLNAPGKVDSAKELIDAGVQMDLRDNLELFLTTNNPSTFVSNIYTYIHLYMYIYTYKCTR
jgi:hypothetical protein